MTDAAVALVRAGLLTLKLPADTASLLVEFGQLVVQENSRTNLTSARDVMKVCTDHILDSLAPLPLATLHSPIVDVGSGAGFPGIPAAIVYPKLRFVLLEPRRKRAEFLRLAVNRLNLRNVAIVQSSVGGPGGKELEGKAGAVLMRAVAKPQRSLEFGISLLRKGAALVLYAGDTERKSELSPAALRRHGIRVEVKALSLPWRPSKRYFWIASCVTASRTPA